jgi:hypothetical protein
VRWLRPAFQHPQPSAAPPTQATLGMEGAGAQPEAAAAARIPEPPTQAWPATLPEQMRAVADLLAASAQPLDLEALTSRFKGRGPLEKKACPASSTPSKPWAAPGAKGRAGGGELDDLACA